MNLAPFFAALVSAGLAALACTAMAAPGTVNEPAPFGRSGNWTPILDEEFDGPTLDATRWATCFWWSSEGCTNAGNNDRQWYLPQNVTIRDGVLQLIAKPEQAEAPDGRKFHYTSGMVATSSTFSEDDRKPPLFEVLYGFFEIRAKLPAGRGLFPAFWLSPSDDRRVPEIDVAETIGQEPDVLTTNFHYRGQSGRIVHVGHRTKTVDLTQDWHVYAMQWRPDALIWYLDGVEVWRFTEKQFIPSTPMCLLLTLSVGGNWPGDPDETTPFPAVFQIDYVRAWQSTPPAQ